MSIDLNWETLTTGPDGAALAHSIRDFIHDRFQTVTLPRFIKQVSVHAFDFGSTPPEIEIKDICDPLPDFYEKNDDDDGEEDDAGDHGWQSRTTVSEERSPRYRQQAVRDARSDAPLPSTDPPLLIDTRWSGFRHLQSPTELESPLFRTGTPGISGGTSNLNYFHSHFATGLSGTQTPLAAVAGAHLPRGWPDHVAVPENRHGNHRSSTSRDSISPPLTADPAQQQQQQQQQQQRSVRESDAMPPPSAPISQRPHSEDGLPRAVDGDPAEPVSPPRRFHEPRVEDLQTVFRVKYAGDVKLSLTAEILLDYPMPSFVGIPVQLKITGLSFDGVAVVAYIRRRAHFCFLSPEDALTAIGPEADENGGGLRMGGLLQEIKVESEIGQRENGKQSLKNVGKVEKFVLEQVRRIFEDEFVYPSFWTFLV